MGVVRLTQQCIFDSLGGTDIPSIYVSDIKDGENLTPTKEGYDFQYWAYDISFFRRSNA